MEKLKVDLSGKVVIITGASSGIGKELANYISSYNPKRLILPVRNRTKSQATLEYIKEKNGFTNAELWDMDLADLTSVRSFAKKVVEEVDQVHVLINNAGVVLYDLSYTKNGLETHFQVNYLGHFLLTTSLLDTLKKSGTDTFPARVINVSSFESLNGVIDYNNIDGKKSSNALEMYRNSKLMNHMFSNELNKRLAGTNVVSLAMCPGFINTNIGEASGLAGMWRDLVFTLISATTETASHNVLKPSLLDVQQNAGKFFRDGELSNGNPLADDEELRIKFWEYSEHVLAEH
ncbi:5818_t:CDS:2 [Ambispora gerdemannii]|uniref:5818_t:CDS:1 n=1 Tax=Ambispora gerdemannii TaxID=144530 RepID=A0A9N9B4B1_9GLOM|nr:5818_t:CDS:2 [Ambispora gerdemannii]